LQSHAARRIRRPALPHNERNGESDIMQKSHNNRLAAALVAGALVSFAGQSASAQNGELLFLEDFENLTTEPYELLDQFYDVQDYYSSNAETTVAVQTVASLAAPEVSTAQSGDYVVSGWQADGNGLDSSAWFNIPTVEVYEQGRTYEFGMWVKSADEAGDFSSLYFFAGGQFLFVGNLNTPGNEWTYVSATLTADAGLDGEPIDFWIYHYGDAVIDDVSLSIYCEAGDLDGDGDVDQSDLGILLANYGCVQ
jgi:hypothetical protein